MEEIELVGQEEQDEQGAPTNANLFAFQEPIIEDAVQAYLTRGRTYCPNFMGVGEGKTVVTTKIITRILPAIKERMLLGGDKEPMVLVVVPASVKYNWNKEIRKYDARVKQPWDVVVIDDARDDRANVLTAMRYVRPKWLIINYNLLVLHILDIIAILDRNIDICVLDEAHHIQHGDTDTSKCVLALEVHYRFALTGTPIANRIDSMYNILRFLNPEHRGMRRVMVGSKVYDLSVPTGARGFGSEDDFVTQYAQFETNARGGRKITGVKNVPQLQRKLKEMGAIITDNPLELQRPKTLTQSIPLLPDQVQWYNAIKEGIAKWAATDGWSLLKHAERMGDPSSFNMAFLAKLTFAQMATNMSPRHLRDHMRIAWATGQGLELDKDIYDVDTRDNAKLAWLKEFMQDRFTGPIAEPGGVLGYSKFTNVIDEYCKEFGMLGKTLGLDRIDGSVTARRKYEIQERVLAGKSRMVFTTDAGGEGINLQGLNWYIAAGLNWNPMHYIQSIGRIVRPGQKNEMHALVLLSPGTVDTKFMLPRLMGKERDARRVLHGERGGKNSFIMKINDVSEIGDML